MSMKCTRETWDSEIKSYKCGRKGHMENKCSYKYDDESPYYSECIINRSLQDWVSNIPENVS